MLTKIYRLFLDKFSKEVLDAAIEGKIKQRETNFSGLPIFFIDVHGVMVVVDSGGVKVGDQITLAQNMLLFSALRHVYHKNLCSIRKIDNNVASSLAYDMVMESKRKGLKK